MPTVRIRFPGGRYHATPWGHHVNEGLIEWPPSPWRLLRALLATGFASHGWSEVPSIAQNLIDKLAAVLPSYHLPNVSSAHSRHFMPIGTIAKGREKTNLVFDAWASVGQDELLVHWPCDLEPDELELFSRLIATLGYLGRSESWIEAALMTSQPQTFNAVPCVEHERRGPGWEQLSLIAALNPVDYEHWSTDQRQKALSPFAGQKQTAAVKKKQLLAIEPYPPNLLSCLTKDTAWWKGHGWSQPPGSQRVLYWRRSDSLQVAPPAATRSFSVPAVTTMILAITTPSGNRSALPPVTRTLPQAELFHRAIVGRLGQGQRVHCPELTGKDALNRPLKTDHQHAHTIPIDLDGDGHIDHLIVHAAMGLRDEAQNAIRTLRRTWTKGGAGELQLALVGSGDIDILRQLNYPFKSTIDRLLGPSQGAHTWESVTPFVLPKTPDRRSKRSIAGQVHSELAARALPAAIHVEVIPTLTQALRHFVRRRNHGGGPPKNDTGYAIRIQLSEPIHGPLLLGYGAHYGLGRFQACTE